MGKDWVMITGVATGLGYQFLRTLSTNGYNVIGTVRSEIRALELKREFPNAHFVKMDFMNPASMEQGFEQIQGILSGRALIALINNAGIAKGGPIAYLKRQEWEDIFNVNVLGMVSCIQFAYPYLVLSNEKARIINISSVSGVFASPFLGAYVASKFAVEGLTDSLRRESKLLGIKVILIQAGPIKTPIWAKSLGLAKKFEMSPFEPFLRNSDEQVRNFEKAAMEPWVLDNVILDALKNKRPKNRYLIHKSPRFFRFAAYLMPSKWTDALLLRQIKRNLK